MSIRPAPLAPHYRAEGSHLIPFATTAAMTLLQHGVDLTVIALWLGHESIETTNQYLHADMLLKERALGYGAPKGAPPTRFQPQDSLLAFLKAL